MQSTYLLCVIILIIIIIYFSFSTPGIFTKTSKTLAQNLVQPILGNAGVGSEMIATNATGNYLFKSHTRYVISLLLQHVFNIFSSNTNAGA